MPNARRSCRSLLLPAVLALAAVAALVVDLPVAAAFQRWNLKPVVHAYLGYFDMFEPFGHGWGVALVLLALHQLDPGRRWAIPRVICCAAAAGGLADLLKMLVVRVRPNDFTFDGPVWTTFGGWLPMLGFDSGQQSFPSAHTATAAGLAAAMIWLYPRGRCLFTLLVVLVGCQRVVSGAHYPSDVLLGAAVGCLAASLLLTLGWLPGWFGGWEKGFKGLGIGD